tara:strand:+ start:269 stop:697 length:429 start_codon:yes stop_codon:yes gene_type:complete
MKTLIILTISAGILLTTSSHAADTKNIQETLNIQKTDKSDCTSCNLGNTLNLYKNNNTPNVEKNLYLPINLKITSTKNLSLKERRHLKKTEFFKTRRARKYKRIMKKMNFYKERRRKKFHNQIYLWKWFQKNQIKTSRQAIS